ncbi:50S ribosomal protein L15 [bacterium]|nr:50S ribosomal protein L15 [bacterium]
MKLSNLPKIKGNTKRKIRRGRGAASHGRYCGFGMNGQQSRSGRTKSRHFEGGNLPTFRKIPMLKGFRSLNPKEYATVNLRDLERRFPQDTEITIGLLIEEGLVRNDKLPVKLLGEGELTRSMTIKVHAASKSAREKIEAADAKLEIIGESE